MAYFFHIYITNMHLGMTFRNRLFTISSVEINMSQWTIQSYKQTI